MIQPTGRVTLEEFLAIAAAAGDVRLEYRDGYVVALAEAGGNHERIKNNLVAEFYPLVRATGCEFFSGGVKLICPNGDRTIPDIGVSCDKRDKDAMDRAGEAQIEHPWLIIEILSPGTEATDRGGKLDAYNAIAELTHYVLIDSRRQWILVHVRTADGLLAINGPLECFTLPSLGEVSSATVYRSTTVPRIG
jgi:Uma2 family endonuclease